MDKDTPEGLPLIYQDVVTVFEEFRLYALPRMEERWAQTLPRVPLTKVEIKTRLRTRLESDEQLVLRQIRNLGSVSAGIIVRLELTREMAQAAMSILRDERPAQAALIAILALTRFRYFCRGVLIPTCCRRLIGGESCNGRDTFDHLACCYALQAQLKT